MERTEPTFVPEWLKGSGGLSTSLSKSDEQGSSKSLKNKLLDKDLGRVSVSDRTTSSYFRRASISNGSANLRSYSNFNRGNKDGFEFRNKEKSENRHADYSDSLGNNLPIRFEKDRLRRSRSSVSGNVKTSFERNFPSLGEDEKQVDSDIGRVSSKLSTAIQSLPGGSPTVIGGEGWTSALAEVPVIVSNNNGNGSSVQHGQPNSISATISLTGGRNMAETLAHGPTRSQPALQLSVGTQRLEELAVKQSRQLIPMTPPMPKALGCDKPKLKIGQSQPPPRSSATDVSKTSTTVGKLLVLKPSSHGISKESLSPSNLLNSPPHAAAVPLGKKRPPSLQAQSRSNFFNLMRKKSMAPGEPPVVPQGAAVVQRSSVTKVDQSGPDVVEEEEARLLRAMGWEETAQEEVLTEEEISSFYQHLLKVRPTSKGAQPKLLMPTSFNSKLES